MTVVEKPGSEGMAKRGKIKILTVSTLLALGLGVSCSGAAGEPPLGSTGAGGSDGSGGSGVSGGSGGFIAINLDAALQEAAPEDAALDALTPEQSAEGAVPITEDEMEAMRNQACTGWRAAPEWVGASMLLVVDASSSMRETANGTGNRSKWEVTRDALVETVNSLSDDTAVGVLGYPNMDIQQGPGIVGDPANCVNIGALVVPQMLGTNNQRQIVVDALNAIQTHTCTPTHDAYALAVEAYAATPTSGQKYILLMTDGAPTLLRNCEDGSCVDRVGAEQPVIDEVANALATYGIRTFVLGSPGSETHAYTGLDNRWWLSQAAEAGGTSPGNCSHTAEPYCHFDMTQATDFGAALQTALSQIVGMVVRCDYTLPAPPPGETLDTNAINMILWPNGVDAYMVLRAPDASCVRGWYLDPATQEVRLCSETCDLAQSDPAAQLELMFGCASQTFVPE
jgi:hypothetical protein